ncbi:MAG TPA: Gfo/Idh/MocA family oxidoreductase, partial [Williamwhitmania sp.]|nr:Gfo/Idh/MocA family oxidoreductase [Williamwhitmania sp.]
NHAKNVIRAVEESCASAIICEKPMALTVEDAEKMNGVCEEFGAKLFVVKQNRYNLPVLKLREALELGRFGKLFLGTIRLRWHRDQNYFDMDDWRGTWKMDGGVAASQASHHVDLLQWMMGDVKWVQAHKATLSLDIEVDDTMVAILGFESGAVGVIEATNATQPENLEGSLSVLGENGTVVIGGIAVNKMETWKFKKAHKMDVDVMEHSENPKDVYGFGHARFYENVVQNIKSGKGTVVDGEEGLKSLKLINAIYESAETGTKVYLKKESKLGK